ncbi:MAG TPA: universal stress protein [Caulobacteraceae bacterium]|nr:universal stress protein [Caulobacteraceae bacterium]
MALVQDSPVEDRMASAKAAFRTILVHVQAKKGPPLRLAAAVALTRSLHATVIGVGAEMMQPVIYADVFGMAGAEWTVEARNMAIENLERAEALFHDATKGLSRGWLKVEDFPVSAMQIAAGGADLIVAGGPKNADDDGYRWCDPAELAIKTGRPVVVVPAQGGALQTKKILVAWKNTREARRAVADAMPFLKAAEEVLVLALHEEDDAQETSVQMDTLLGNLRRHGVLARGKVSASLPALVGSELLKAAKDMQADLIVAGAYGHTRLGEWAFGGATRTLLTSSDRHLLISH